MHFLIDFELFGMGTLANLKWVKNGKARLSRLSESYSNYLLLSTKYNYWFYFDKLMIKRIVSEVLKFLFSNLYIFIFILYIIGSVKKMPAF